MEHLLREEKAVEEPIRNSSLSISASGRESPVAAQGGEEDFCLIGFFNPLSQIPQQFVKWGDTSFHLSEHLYLRKICSGKQQGYHFSCLQGWEHRWKKLQNKRFRPSCQAPPTFWAISPHVNSLLSLEFVAMSLLQHREEICLKDSAFAQDEFRVER